MKKNILVADDNKSIVEVISIVLEEKGYGVATINDGHTIFYHATRDKPDLILLDLWMSGIDGAEVTHKLKNQKETREIPIIIVSAKPDTEKIAKECGADGFLYKPFDIEDLASIVAKHIRKT